MRIGILGGFQDEASLQKELDSLCEAGFHYLDFQGFANFSFGLYDKDEEQFEAFMRYVKEECDKRDVHIHQLHSLWVGNMYDFDAQEVLFSKTIRYYERSLKGARLLGCPIVVVHHRIPVPYERLDAMKDALWAYNIAFLKVLMPLAHRYEVKIALENLPFPWESMQFEDTVKQIEEIDDDHLGMCLDTGHFNMFSNGYSIEEGIKRAGKKLFALHCHDNDGTRDAHAFPGDGTLDWKALAKGLKEIDFQGVFSWETASRSKDRAVFVKENHQLLEFAEDLLK